MAGYRKAIDEHDLEAVLGKLDKRSQEFAQSLINSARDYGLSSKQLYWVERLVRRGQGLDEETGLPRGQARVIPAEGQTAAGGASRAQETASYVATALRLIAKFAATGSQMPKIWVKVAGESAAYKFSRLGNTSRTPGDIAVATSATYYGRIEWASGCFVPARGQVLPVAAFGALAKFLDDPAAAAKTYAEAEHHCCFCAEDLTDPRSIEAGYGPVCARKYQLPWGGKTREAA